MDNLFKPHDRVTLKDFNIINAWTNTVYSDYKQHKNQTGYFIQYRDDGGDENEFNCEIEWDDETTSLCKEENLMHAIIMHPRFINTIPNAKT